MNKVYWVRAKGEPEDSTYGYVERIELSTGDVILFDKDEEKIDLTPLRHHAGETIESYRDGKLLSTHIIDGVGPDDENNGVMTLWMTAIPEEKDKNSI